MTKKILAIILALILLFQAVPTQAFATGGVEEPIVDGEEVIIPDGEVEGEAVPLLADGEEVIIPDGEVEGEAAPLLAAENPGDNSRAPGDNSGFPDDVDEQVYVAIYDDGNRFPGEPAWYPQDNYTFIRKSGNNLSTGLAAYANSAEGILDETILDHMFEGSSNNSGERVWGYYSADGTNNYILDKTLTSEEGQERIIELVTNRDATGYKIIWYVIKYQTDSQWHIDGLIVKKDTYNVNYYSIGHTSGNAPTGAKNLEAGYEYTVLGNAGNLKRDGYTFNGWNTQADGTGTSYAPGATITITEDVSLYAQWVPNKTDITVTKVWDDKDNQDGIRPNSVTVHLLANGAHDASRKVTLTADKNWSASWEKLPTVDSNGKTITYTVEEEAVTGYTAKVTGSASTGFTITNTHTPATTTVQAQKVWYDADDQDGLRPTSVTLQLYKQVGDGAAVAVTNDGTREAKYGNSWTAQWHNLPKYEGGQLITYSVKEAAVPEGYQSKAEYEASTGRWVVTNTYTSQKTSITINKVWDDARNQDGKRPTSVTVNLLADGQSTGKTVTLDASNNWKATVNDLPVYAEGEKIVYTVVETNVPEGYTPAVNGFTITNSYTPATISVPVEKVWNDANNQDGKRPSSVTVTLLANGTSTGKTVTLNADNGWKGSFDGLAEYSAGNKITYTVVENTVAGYSANIVPNANGGYTITNTHTPATTEVTITKVWEDANNQDGIRPASVTVEVYNGEQKAAETVVSASHGWKATVTDLPMYENGQLITYTVKEPTVPEGYTSSVNGYTITNTHTPVTTEVTITKVWEDGNNQDGKRPQSITLHLLADEDHMGENYKAVVSADADGNWTYTWEGLPVYAKGHKIQYSVAEEVVEEYTASYAHDQENPNIITITNSYTPQKTAVNVEKIWHDADDQDGKRPETIKVQLLKEDKNGKLHPVKDKELELSAENGWEGVFADLPAFEDVGKEIKYGVKEKDVPKEYTSVVKEDERIHNSFLIVNSYTPKKIDIPVTKEWDDNNDQDGKRPESITVKLQKQEKNDEWKDVKKVQPIVLNAEHEWTDIFEGIDRYEQQGQEIQYRVVESNVPEGYESVVTGSVTEGFVITNTHAIEKTSISVTKAWEDADNQDGIRPGTVKVTLLADNVAVGAPVELTAEKQWSYTFENLDKYKAGKEIQYAVEEEFVTGYSTAITGTAATGFTITNTHEPEVIDIPVTKVWEDANNQDGIRPTSITVTLNENGQATDKTLSLSADNNWMGEFENLPKKAAGQDINYTVDETAYTVIEENEAVEKEGIPAGYDKEMTGSAAAGFTITNTYVPELTKLTVVKVWKDGNNQDGTRPQAVEFHLLADGVHTGNTVTLMGRHVDLDGNWSYTWENLPKYAAGKEIKYIVYESKQLNTEDDVLDVPDVYDVSYVRDTVDSTKITVTNSYTPETTEVTVVKVWDDGDNRDKLRPDSITVTLYADDEATGKTVILNEANNWTDSWTDLPKNKNGQAIVYTVEENAPVYGEQNVEVKRDQYETEDGETVFTNEFIITNTHKPKTTEVTVTKTWDDNDNQDGIRPDSVEVVLFRNGTAFGDHIKLNATNNWTYTFEDLFVNDGRGGQYTYTVVEDVPEGYTAEVTGTAAEGFTITNTHTPEVTSVTVTKTWTDGNNQDGIRPTSIIVNLLNNEDEVVGTAELKADAQGIWTHTFSNLPKYNEGVEIVYTVAEAEVDGYTPSIDGFTITNSHTPATTSVSVTKVWDDNDDQDGKRPATLTVTLYAGGEAVMDGENAKKLTLSEANNWSGVIENLPKFAGGKAINYSVEEVTVANYEKTEYKTVAGENGTTITITNTHTPEEIEISVEKVWNDERDQDGIRPDSITVTLKADGAAVDTMILTAEDDWSGVFTELPKYADGKEITYTVEEAGHTIGAADKSGVPAGYSAVVTGSAANGFTITNTHDVLKTTVTATKVWSDKDNQDGKRPAEITVHLLADNKDTGKKVVLNESNEWTYTWTDLDLNAIGKAIQYTVAEEVLEDSDYSVSYSTDTEAPYEITVTNAYTPEETSVRALKVWDDANNQDGIRPATVTLQLYKTVDGAKTAVGEPVQIADAHQWSKLPKYEDGKLITYSVEETDVPEGYTVSYSTEGTDLIVKNTHAPEMIDEIAVTKVWDDANDQDGIRPDSVTVALHANGEAVKTLTLTAEGKWSGEFKDLPKFANGKEITYTVAEPTVPEGYKATIDGFTITNTHVPATTEVTVTKVWNDAHNQDGIRPETITAQIYANGKVVETVELTAENNWKATVSDLPKNADGELIAYTVKEKNVPAGYTASVEGFTITNTHAVAKTEVSVKKLWVDENDQDGKRPAAVTVGLYADGVFTGKTLVLSAANGWYAQFEDLDEFHQGKVITYTVLENAVIDYAPVYNYSVDAKDGTTHVTITNIHAIDLVSIPVQKIWNDADDQDGKRPDSITVTLYADGRTTGKTLTLNAENLWMDTFVGLPKNKDGKQIEYSVLENAVDGYTAQIKAVNGKFVITNTHEVEKTELTAVKVWQDANNQDGKRPDEIVLHLLANGVRVDKATLTAEGKWTYTWKDLDKYAAGQEITYSVSEEPIADASGKQIYTVSYKQNSATKITVTNAYTPETIAVQTQKVWEDGHDRDGLRPESITVTLLGNGKKVASVVLNEKNEWTDSWTNLPKFEQGKEIQYTVVESEVPDGYESTVALREDGQYIITNTHTPATTGVTVEKIWADENNNDGKRPDGIIVQLYADGSAVENGKVILDEKSGWTYAWESSEEMPLYVLNQGEEIHYYVQEIGYIIDGVEYAGLPEGYVGSTATGEAYAVTITNTRAVEKISVSVVKAWADQNDNDGIRPESVEMTLLKNGAQVETVTLNADNNWTYTWKDLYKYAEGELVKYTVAETAVDGYEAAYAAAEGDDQITITVTNTHVAETKEVTVTKVWKDNNDEEDLRPDSVTVQLYKNGEAYGETIKLSAANSWSYAAELPVYEDGEKITWSVKEIGIPRYYTVSYDQNTLTITNTIQSKDVPKSGDFNHLWMWFVLMGGCTAGAVSIVLGGKKKGKYAK